MVRQPYLVHPLNVDPEAARLVEMVVADIMTNHHNARFRQAVREEPIYVWPWPQSEHIAAVGGIRSGALLLGLHHGVPWAPSPPHYIALFTEPIRQVANITGVPLYAQIKATLEHEIEHHLGIDHALPTALIQPTCWPRE